MRIESIRSYLGANVVHPGPAVVLTVNTEPGDEKATSRVFQLAFETLCDLGIAPRHAAHRRETTSHNHHFIFETDHEIATSHLLEHCLENDFPTQAQLIKALELRAPGLTTEALSLRADAVRAGIPAFKVEKQTELQIGHGRKLRRVRIDDAAALRSLHREILLQDSEAFRIPIVSITGTNGKTTVTRMIAHILANAGLRVGTTSTEGILIGDDCIKTGDLSGPRSALKVLSDSSVEAAVLETARGGIVRAGLGYDHADVAVLTNIHPDHLGQDGIRRIEDLVRIKRVVTGAVRRGGTLVLNADDPKTMELLSRGDFLGYSRYVTLFSMDALNPIVAGHLAGGGRAVFLKEQWIIASHGREEQLALRSCDVPASFGGSARFQLSNAAAAIAAVLALKMPMPCIASGMRAFRNNQQNRGRNNLFQLSNGYLLVDYGHNPEAIRAIGEMVSSWKMARSVCILGLPGDREDSILRESAITAAKYFEKVILREEVDLRGRRHGEVPQLALTAIREHFPRNKASIILEESDALHSVAKEMRPGDVTVHFFDQWEKVQAVLHSFNAESLVDLSFEGIRVAS